jgi:hypothetical protein
VGKRNKIAAEEIVYWEPAANTEQASFSSTVEPEKEKEQAIYYKTPQTPQEAIEMGLVASAAVKPKNFIPHWKRLGICHKPKYWHCWWGCEGVVSVMDNPATATHDYYCPYWAMLQLFPEWEKDFWYTFLERPPMPDGGPPYLEEYYNERRKQHDEILAARDRDAERNPFNMEDEQAEFRYSGTRTSVSRSDKDRGKDYARDGIRTTPFSKEYHEAGEEIASTEWSFDVPKSKQKRSSSNRKRNK